MLVGTFFLQLCVCMSMYESNTLVQSYAKKRKSEKDELISLKYEMRDLFQAARTEMNDSFKKNHRDAAVSYNKK